MSKTLEPAFPCAGDTTAPQGMTLRDYIAVEAMNALIHSGAEVSKHVPDGVLTIPGLKGIPMLAYDYADAMLEAREPSHG